MKYEITLPDSFNSTSLSDLLENQWFVPRKQRHFLRTKKNILVNGQNVNWDSTVNPKDNITIIFEKSDLSVPTVTFGNKNLIDCLYEDNHIIIVNKPEGMKTHPNNSEEIELLNHVSAYINGTAFVVHRLDKDTSGAILFAKNPFVLPILDKLLEEKKISRTYQALCHGQIKPQKFTINKPIGKNRHDKSKRIVSQSGQKAITYVEVLKNLGQNTLVSCVLETGRTHQIRVHLSNRGNSIVGDPLYSHYNENSRLMLHAKVLSFIHPFTQEKIEVTANSKSFDKKIRS